MLTYEESKKIIHPLKIPSISQYFKWRKANKERYSMIPYYPNRVYKKYGFTWEEFLGDSYKETTTVDRQAQQWTYEEASDLAKKFRFTSVEQWSDYISKHELPLNFPRLPDRYFSKRDQWTGWADFLGTKENRIYHKTIDKIGTKEKPDPPQFNASQVFTLPFPTFRENIRRLQLESKEQYHDWNRINEMAIKGYPMYPDHAYSQRKQWTNWLDVLGKTNYLDTFFADKCEYIEAKKFAQSLNIKSESEWRHFWIKNPDYRTDIPRYPDVHYKHYWESWPKFLGTQISYRLSEQLYNGAVLFVARTSKYAINTYEIAINKDGPNSLLNFIYLNQQDWKLIKCYKYSDEVMNSIHKNTQQFVEHLIKKHKGGEHPEYEGVIINNIYELLYDLDYYFEVLTIDDIKINKYEFTAELKGHKNTDKPDDTLKLDDNDAINFL